MVVNHIANNVEKFCCFMCPKKCHVTYSTALQVDNAIVYVEQFVFHSVLFQFTCDCVYEHLHWTSSGFCPWVDSAAACVKETDVCRYLTTWRNLNRHLWIMSVVKPLIILDYKCNVLLRLTTYRLKRTPVHFCQARGKNAKGEARLQLIGHRYAATWNHQWGANSFNFVSNVI